MFRVVLLLSPEAQIILCVLHIRPLVLWYADGCGQGREKVRPQPTGQYGTHDTRAVPYYCFSILCSLVACVCVCM